MGLLLFFAIVALVATRVATPEERNRARETGAALVGEVRRAVALNGSNCQPFYEALRARRPLALLVPTLVGLQAVVLLGMAVSGSPGDPRTLVAWGASFGPRTTNGEWWRLISASFVHSGLVPALVNGAAFLQVGLVLERLAGRATLAAAFLSGGLFAQLAALSSAPMAVTAGASGAVFGVCGLLCAASFGRWWKQEELLVPRVVLKRLAPVTALFCLFNLANADLPVWAEAVGFASGLLCGILLEYRAGEEGPTARRIWISAVSALVVVAAAAVPMRGVTDVRPEITRLVSMEDRTAATYRAAAARLKTRQIDAEALVRVIQDEILTELHEIEARLQGLTGVPAEDRALTDAAAEYLRLRAQSWNLRVESLRAASPSRTSDTTRNAAAQQSRRETERKHHADNLRLGNAEMTERAALHTLERLKQLD